ncbi:MAG TPA: lysophospholipid acyltransferase family protein [Bacteroidales bacterium]|nr:lysophospholipid acyltransferase family protein [Bacteroidales bacterium]
MDIPDTQNNSENTNKIIPEGTILSETLLHIFNLNQLRDVYNNAREKDPVSLINALFEILDLKIDLPDDDLANIPEKGPFIVISNHPYQGIDSMLLYRLINTKRPDFKILGSYLLQSAEPFRNIIIPVNTTEGFRPGISSYKGIKKSLFYLNEGHCLGIFPTAEDSKHWVSGKIIIDREWKPAALKLIRMAGVPVIPVYFHGTRTRIAHMLQRINPGNPLPVELLRKKKRTIKIRIGAPVSIKEQSEFSDITYYGRYLRAKVYSLGSAIETRKTGNRRFIKKYGKKEAVVEAVPQSILLEEFLKVRKEYELFSAKNYSAICAPAEIIPNIFHEIGRLREITFRDVGEGTGKSIDLDEYDFYYYHLFIWDTDENRIVGSYRIGKGKEIAGIYGIKGFYISSLFRIKKKFLPKLAESLELGRSFVTRDYQKKAFPLFLLWKGIMVFLLRHEEYRYLIGPVSISNDLSEFSKKLIVGFIRSYFFDSGLSKFVVPKKDFIVDLEKLSDHKVFIDSSDKNINKLEKIILDIEPGYRLPVLLKKYLEINGKIVGFNIDPKFNNCVDGLLILDLLSVPDEFIKGLAREMDDPSILERFRK